MTDEHYQISSAELEVLINEHRKLEELLQAATMFQFGRYQVAEYNGRWYVITVMDDGDADWQLESPFFDRDEAIEKARRLTKEKE